MKLFSVLFALQLVFAMDLVVPAYFYPEKTGMTYWKNLATTAAQVPMTVIINPDNGPGSSIDTTYATVSNNVRKAGAKMIGYISSLYGKRPLNEIKSEIDAYLRFYTVDGFFIDEMSDEATSAIIQFYKAIYSYVKGKNSRFIVMTNPGTTIPEVFLKQQVADRFVVFESSQKDYSSFSQPAWQNNYPASTFVHIVYNANASQMTDDVQFAKSRNIGGVFVSNANLPNPYDILPPYWNNEVAAAVAANGEKSYWNQSIFSFSGSG